jgi:hypothetical protein
VRCGLKFSRGKDQLVGVRREHAVSTCCSSATTTSRTSSRRTSATSGSSGSNCRRRKAPRARGARASGTLRDPAQSQTSAAAGCRSPYPEEMPWAGPATPGRQAHRHDLPLHAGALAGRQTPSAPRSVTLLRRGRDRAPARVVPTPSATSSPPARPWSPTACAKSRWCSKATPCIAAHAARTCRRSRPTGSSGC